MVHGNDSNKVVVTGIGPVTSIGCGTDPFWQSLRDGRSNVSSRRLHTDIAHVADWFLAGMPPLEAMPEMGRHTDFLRRHHLTRNRDLAFALLAIELALADSGVSFDPQHNNIGVVQVFEAPGVEATVTKLFEICSSPPGSGGPPPVYETMAPYFYNSQAFLYVHAVGKAFGFHGFSTSVHNACSSAAYAIETAASRIRSGAADVMIVAGGEAFDTAVRIEWFRRQNLYALSPQMRPFDAEPLGFYVGEGGAALVLESQHHAERRGAKIYAHYQGAAFAQQGWKQAIPDVRAERLTGVIRAALKQSGTHADQVDLVLPHAAGTGISDGYESLCLGRAFDGRACRAAVTAFKPHFGHMLAASGLIEVAALMLALEHQTIPGTLFTRPEKAKICLPLITRTTAAPLRTALKLSTGFTGHDAASVFTRP